jgi:hypothetical protein
MFEGVRDMRVRVERFFLIFLMIGTLCPVMAGCAHQDEQASSAQWGFDGSQYSPVAEDPLAEAQPSWPASGARVDGAAEDVSGEAAWSERTYVYRGGRDPKTGVAYNQM